MGKCDKVQSNLFKMMASPAYYANGEHILVLQNYIRKLIIALYVVFIWLIILTVVLAGLTIINSQILQCNANKSYKVLVPTVPVVKLKFEYGMVYFIFLLKYQHIQSKL